MKTIIGVSKKHNSIWRVYGYDYNEDDNLVLVTKKINPLLVWFYKLKKRDFTIIFVKYATKNLDFTKAGLIKCLMNVLIVILISLVMIQYTKFDKYDD